MKSCFRLLDLQMKHMGLFVNSSCTIGSIPGEWISRIFDGTSHAMLGGPHLSPGYGVQMLLLCLSSFATLCLNKHVDMHVKKASSRAIWSYDNPSHLERIHVFKLEDARRNFHPSIK